MRKTTTRVEEDEISLDRMIISLSEAPPVYLVVPVSLTLEDHFNSKAASKEEVSYHPQFPAGSRKRRKQIIARPTSEMDSEEEEEMQLLRNMPAERIRSSLPRRPIYTARTRRQYDFTRPTTSQPDGVEAASDRLRREYLSTHKETPTTSDSESDFLRRRPVREFRYQPKPPEEDPDYHRASERLRREYLASLQRREETPTTSEEDSECARDNSWQRCFVRRNPLPWETGGQGEEELRSLEQELILEDESSGSYGA